MQTITLTPVSGSQPEVIPVIEFYSAINNLAKINGPDGVIRIRDKQYNLSTLTITGLTGMFSLIGNIDTSTFPPYPAAESGDAYKVSISGKVGGPQGMEVRKDDILFATQSSSGGSQSEVGDKWDKLDGISIIPVVLTLSELKELKASASLDTRVMYFVSDKDIFLRAIDVNKISCSGYLLARNPDYQNINGNNAGIWNTELGELIADVSITIWNGLHFKSTTGTVGNAPDTDIENWLLLPQTDPSYVTRMDCIEFDLDGEVIVARNDGRNFFTTSKELIDQLGYNPIEKFQWGRSGVFGNRCRHGLINNLNALTSQTLICALEFGNVTVAGQADCSGVRASQAGKVHASGQANCRSARVSQNSQLNAGGTANCERIIIMSASEVNVSGSANVSGAKVTGGSELNAADNANCSQVNLNNSELTASGLSNCQGARLSASSELNASGSAACNNVILYGGELTATGNANCSGARVSDGELSASGNANCSGITLENDSEVSAADNANCSGAVAKNSSEISSVENANCSLARVENSSEMSASGFANCSKAQVSNDSELTAIENSNCSGVIVKNSSELNTSATGNASFAEITDGSDIEVGAGANISKSFLSGVEFLFSGIDQQSKRYETGRSTFSGVINISDANNYAVAESSLSIPETASIYGMLKITADNYSAATSYSENNIVKDPATGVLYKSLIDNNQGNTLEAGANWDYADAGGGNTGAAEISEIEGLPANHPVRFFAEDKVKIVVIPTAIAGIGANKIALVSGANANLSGRSSGSDFLELQKEGNINREFLRSVLA